MCVALYHEVFAIIMCKKDCFFSYIPLINIRYIPHTRIFLFLSISPPFFSKA